MKKLALLATLLASTGFLFGAAFSSANATESNKDAVPSYVIGQPLTVNMELLGVNGNTPVGTVTVEQTPYGVVFQPHLKGLPAGVHGFHVHAGTSCAPGYKNGKLVLGLAAKGHYDPFHTGKHSYPWDPNGHKGDLPVLYVDNNGNADQPVLAPRLSLQEIEGLALMIHAGGDNHSDHPAPLGGGGARLACGVIPKAN